MFQFSLEKRMFRGNLQTPYSSLKGGEVGVGHFSHVIGDKRLHWGSFRLGIWKHLLVESTLKHQNTPSREAESPSKETLKESVDVILRDMA